MHYVHRPQRKLCALIFSAALALNASAVAKNSHDVKTGVNNITKKAVSNVKQKQPQQIKKTPSPGGPVAIPYPN
jgi:hypothetical protein